MRRFACLSLFVLAATAEARIDPEVSAKPSKTRLTVGERFEVEVRARGPQGTAWTFPPEAGDDKVELRAKPGVTSTNANARRESRSYQAAVFAVGEVAVPPIKVGYRLADGSQGEVETEPISVRIVSVLPKDPQDRKLVDIRGPLGLSIGRAFFVALVVAAVLAVVCAVALFWAWWRRRRRAARETVVVQAPDVEALEALDALLGSTLLGRNTLRPFYIALAGIAKRYLERRLAAPVLEMTTTEMVGFLRQHPAADAFADALRDLASAADQVKFAQGLGQRAEAERHSRAVREVVLGLEARLRPQPATQERVA